MQPITTVREFIEALRLGRYTSVGCYPKYFGTDDGCALSFQAARENIWQVARAVRDKSRGRWHDKQLTVFAVDVNWEDPDLRCAHTGERIESAYAED